MKKIILSIFVITIITLSSFAQAPEGFKYQAVIRDAGNIVLNNQAVGIRLAIKQGNIGGTNVYSETFALTTNAYGLANLEIGTGTTTDDFTLIEWANGPYFIETAVDITGGSSYIVMGTSQLLSVPYALYANKAMYVTNDSVNDADADPANELQVISFSNDTLYLSNGGQVFLGAYGIDLVNDADSDPANEIQAISFSNDTVYLSNGGQIFLGAYGIDLVNDADSDPANEIQAISFSNDTVYLSNGGQVFLGAYGIDLVNDADSDPANEIQAISFSNDTVYLSNGGQVFLGAYGIDLVNDGDTNATNEIQTISRTGTSIILSNGGGTIQDSVGVYTAGAGIDISNNVISKTSYCGYAIGDTLQGGYIFYLDPSGCHGLICALTDQSSGIAWRKTSSIDTYSYGNGIGAGYGNTSAIIRWQSSQSGSSAVNTCYNTYIGGYNDWYLPSIYELNLMYENVGPGNALGLGNIGGFSTTGAYWSSTEHSWVVTLFKNFSTGIVNGDLKTKLYRTRAVRSF